jgi:hypothetical protein
VDAKLYGIPLSHPVIGTRLMLLAFPQTAPLAEGRPIADIARRLVPEYPGPIPPALPREWLPAAA